MKINNLFTLILALQFSLYGCNSFIKQTAMPERYIINDNQKSITLTLPSTKPDGAPLNDKDIISHIKTSIIQNSGYKKFFTYERSGNIKKNIGVKFDENNDGVNVSYEREIISGSERTGSEVKPISRRSIASGKINIEAKTQSNIKTYKITSPTSLKVLQDRDILMSPISLMDKEEDLIADINNIVDNINFKMTFTNRVNKEINSNYSIDSIYSNFDRKLPSLGKKRILDDKSLSNTFKSNKIKNCLIVVTVHPYRNGSKVKYHMEYKYTLFSDGKSDYDPTALKVVNNEIEQIINL